MLPVSSLGGYSNVSFYRNSPMYFTRAADLSPVAPVDAAPIVKPGQQMPVDTRAVQPAQAQLPEIREGADPVEMAVRGRIEYLTPEQVDKLIGEKNAPQDVKSPAEVMAESECQTCKERKYQDGSDDPGVSFKTPAHIAPEQAASVVRGHEMEHVVREQAKAAQEDREVVQQSVMLHTAICPECGVAYVSGGTTRTTTVAENQNQPSQQEMAQRQPFEAVA